MYPFHSIDLGFADAVNNRLHCGDGRIQFRRPTTGRTLNILITGSHGVGRRGKLDPHAFNLNEINNVFKQCFGLFLIHDRASCEVLRA